MWGCAVRCLYYSKIVHFCSDLNLAVGQCLNRSSMLRGLELSPLSLGSPWFVLAQRVLLCQVLKTQKLLDWGFQMSLGLEENPLWVSTESPNPSSLLPNLTVRNFNGGKWNLWLDLPRREGLEQLGVWGVWGEQRVFLCNVTSLNFLFQHLHRETPDHTFSQHLLKPGVQTWTPRDLWRCYCLILVHLTGDHLKHDPDFTLSFHIQVFC